jgi:signal transduction histidine kinase
VIKKSGLLNAELEISGEPFYLDAETDLILLRIFQEACNNIIKHANAKNIDVDLFYKPDGLLMKINDDGIGFDIDAVKNNREIRKMSGLKNLETRAQLISATFEIISFPKIGTTINIKIPIKKIQDEK